MKQNGAILYQLNLHVGYYRILRKKKVTVQDELKIAMCFCIFTLLVRQNNALNKANLFTAYVLIFKTILKCTFLHDSKFCVVK